MKTKNIFNSRFTFLFIGVLFCSLCNVANAQVAVSGSTGADGAYTTLKAAFDALNANITQTGNTISITITGNTTETAPAVLNQALGGAWTALTISPSGGNAVIVSGSIPFPLITLNGADNVTIDGLNTGNNSLTISNTSTSNTGAATILFYNDASNNIIQNSTIEGSSTATNLATIGFSGGVATGNDNNTITSCVIKAAGVNTPYNAIGSIGTSALIDNSGITISNNLIQDYFAPDSASCGIFVASFSSAWNITNNKFFQTTTKTATGPATHHAINVATGGGYTIDGNTVGFSTSIATGVTTYDGAFATRFVAIELNVASSPASSVQGNTIAAISLSTTSGATTAPGIFTGIYVAGGTVNVGTVSGNTIGATTGNGSIAITSTTSLAYISGITANSINTVTIQNNLIGSFSTAGGATIGYSFFGINTLGAAGNFTVSTNKIGSATTTHSIAVGVDGNTTSGVCNFVGIQNAATGTIAISNNTIQNCSSFGTAASSFTGINNIGGSATLAISNDSIIASTSKGTGDLIGIKNSAAPTTLNINNNVLRDFALSSTTANFTGILNSGVVTSAININNNQLGNTGGGFVSFSSANSGTLKGISNTDGDDAALLTITGNDIRGISNSVTASNDHYYITNDLFAGSTNISSNTFTNLSVNTSGDIYFINNDVTHAATTTQTVNSNAIVTNYNNLGGGGNVYFYNSYSVSPSSVTEINTGNNFTNLSFSGATDVYGWRTSDGPFSSPGPKKTVTNNTFKNITTGAGFVTALNVSYSDNTYSSNDVSGNTVSYIIAGGDITGITSESGNQNFFNNTVDSLLSYAAGTITGISLTGGTNQNVYKNKIYYLVNTNASGAVDGLLVDAGKTVNVYNNLIGSLSTTASTFTDAVRGISVTSLTTTSNVNVYYNTVYLNATSSGVNFGTTGIYHAASTTATTATLDLRNNIIVNTSTPNGTGLTVAYRRSNGAANRLANYASTSNNNLFYAGTPSATRLIYSDGTSTAQTLSSYQSGVFTAGTIAGRDASSITENPNFLSILGANSNFLHINSTIPTQIESAAQNISTYTDDFDGNIRQGNLGYTGTGSMPDIGADEFNGLIVDFTPPVISYTALSNTSCLANDTIVATITDANSVNTTPGTKPRVWYKKTSNLNTLPGTNTNSTDGWKYTEAINSTSPFNLALDYSLVFGGVSAGDTIQYFVVAQDVVTPTPNFAVNTGTFASPQTSVVLALNAFPVTGVNSYKITSGISGNVTVGSGGTYPTLTGTGGLFETINNGGLAGNVTASIVGNITEPATHPLNSISYGCASNYVLTIKPSASTTPTLTGSNTDAIIKINGADYVTIDGSNSGGSTRDLTITNTNSGTSSAVVWIASASASDGATHNLIKNCNIVGNSPTTTLGGIVSSSGTSLGAVAEAANAYNTYSNNAINTSSYGIAVVGVSTGDSSTVISNNLIGSATPANKIGYRAAFISNQTNVSVNNNTIVGVSTASTSSASGMVIVGAISGGSINANNISDIKNTNTGGYGANGIFLNSTSVAANLTVSNNMIYDVAGYGYALNDGVSDNGYGIIVDDGGGYNIYFNSISMNTNQTDDGLPAALNVTAGVTGTLNVRNNIFSNTQTVGTERYSIICNSPNTVFSDIDYNVYFADTAPNLAYIGANVATLIALKTATAKDSNSLSVAPVFTSATDLHLVVNSNCDIDHKGTPIAGITSDFDNNVRSSTTPDIGADEFINPDPSLSSTLTPPTICSATAFTYTPTSNTSGATFAWSRAAVTGITQAAATGTGNINETLTNTTNASINVTYVFTITANGCTNTQNVVVGVSPQPTLSSTTTPTGICTGNLFSYTPTSNTPGATFSWTRATVAGISNAAGSGTGGVSETLTNTTNLPITVVYVYTVTSNTCSGSSTANVQVTVSPVPSLSSSLSPTTCSGDVFNYTATSISPGVVFTWTRSTVAGISQPGTSGGPNISEVLTNSTSSPVTTTYVYTINASGCSGNSQNVVVTVYPKPVVSLSPFTTDACLQAAPFSLSGGSPSGGVYSGPGVSNGMFNPSIAGLGSKTISYTITTNGCSNAATQQLNVDNCAGINENLASTLVLYPNPNNGFFTVKIDNISVNRLVIKINDIQGKSVFEKTEHNISGDYTKQIDLSNLAKGVYYLELKTDNQSNRSKLIVQ
ncbi:MAG: T9SS type A sorting domain-containing protein [Bacteroidia bacterium]